MDEIIEDAPEVLETPESEDTTEPTETAEEKAARLEAELEAEKDRNKKLYARVRKEEKPEPTAPSNEDTLTAKDALLLAKAGVDMEDLDEVTGFAKFRGISIKEALENKTLKTILAERVEERTTAAAAQVKGPRGTSKETSDQLISKARQGNDVDPEKLAEARMAEKLGK